ncbi:uncharacterized protein LODBEIA_P51550 [Lodderomyces beijingensis]|uniref:Vacuolar protein sorting-associated protein n=1 Tax=Lodderomyces beijingensis TaxID=1775926 RepID=A0ABP0ZRZ9_9ASCO
MFESLVANLLNRFLGAYLENFDPKQLNIGIWGGDVKLTDLRLKKESLDRFKLPIDVKFGHLGVLTLQIPWANLKGKPVQVIIEDLFLLAAPIIVEDFDDEEDEKRQQAVKQNKLKNLESMLEARTEELGKELGDETFAESLITKIVDNLQVTIKNIHVRYEDESVLTESPYTFGASLSELSAMSADENWKPSFISITQAFTRKLLKLDSLSCYMDTQSTDLLSHLDRDKLLDTFKSLKIDQEYLVKPVTGTGKVTVNKAGATSSMPHITSDLFFEEFGVELNSQQYQDILWTASKFHWYMKTAKFRKLRPKLPPSEAPKEWFKYVGRCILDEIHDRNYKWSWEYIQKRREQRLLYMELWKLKLGKKISEAQQKQLDGLEWDLPFDDIKLYRALARNAIRQENAHARLYDTNTAEKSEQKNKGWFSNWWGNGNGAGTNKNNNNQESEKQQTYEADGEHADLSLSDEQRKALYNAIDYDEKAPVTTIDLPEDCVKIRVSASLEKGGLVIRQDQKNNIAEVVFEGCKTQFLQRPHSFLAGFQVQEFRVEDGTRTSIYKHVVSVKQADDQKANKVPFFQLQYEQNPLDGKADSNLSAQLKSMTIFYNPRFIEELMIFFTPPKIHLNTIGAIMNAAESSIEGLTARTRMGLQYALEEHKTINLKLDLQAPLIILPLDPSSFKTAVAILDAGHVSVKSNLVERSKISELTDKSKYTEDDWKRLENLMYDRFTVYLNDIEFYVGHTIKSTMEQLYADEDKRPARMLNNLSLTFDLGVSIIPDAQNLSKIKLDGNIPKVSLAMNDFQYKALMQIIDAAAPNPSPESSDSGSVFNAFGDQPKEENYDIEQTQQSSDLPKDQTTADNSAQKRLFESRFCIKNIDLALSRCIDGVSLEHEPLISFVGESLNLSVDKIGMDMDVDLSLGALSILDRVETSGVAEFEKMMSSIVQEEGQKLLTVKVARKHRSVEFHNKKIDVFDQDIDLKLATVKFVVTRKTLLDVITFSMNTFSDPNAAPVPADELKHNAKDDDAAPQKIDMNVKLESIIVILNDDGLKIATLELDSASIDLFLLPEAMDIKGNLGSLTLSDDALSSDSKLKKLIDMGDKNLAEFSYKTFSNHPQDKEQPSELDFKTGAISVNFVESSFNKIFEFSSQFMKMKAIYDGTREAAMNQAAQLPAKLKFNVLVNAPTITFPLIHRGADTIVANLGEIYAHNEYKGALNVIKTGIRKVNLTSNLSFSSKDVQQTLKILDDLDIGFNINWSESYEKGVPTFAVEGSMPEMDVGLTEFQIKLLTELSSFISDAFTIDSANKNLKDVHEDAAYANEVLKYNTNLLQSQKRSSVVRKPSITTGAGAVDNSIPSIPEDHIMVTFKFDVPLVALTLYNKSEGVKDISKNSLSKFSLNGLVVTLDATQNSQFTSKVEITSFVVEDVRHQTESKFVTLIPAAEGVEKQFVLSASSSDVTGQKSIAVLLTVEKPKLVLALDYLFELQAFFENCSPSQRPPLTTPGNSRRSVVSMKSAQQKNDQDDEEADQTKLGFSINIIKPSVFLLADDSRSDTEAIVFKVEQVQLSKQDIFYLATSNVGMYLARMDSPKTARYKIIDDFSISFAYDDRKSTKEKSHVSLEASVETLVFRVSLRDIRLGYAIIQRANDLFAKHTVSTNDQKPTLSDDFRRRFSQIAPSITSSSSSVSQDMRVNTDKDTGQVPVALEPMKEEELNASFGGVRFVLIGDVSELPVLDMNLKPFDLRAINWSTDLNAEVHIESFVNIFNYANSCWQPLIEPWPVAIYASKTRAPESKLLVETISRQLAEITITSRSVALLSQIQTKLSTDEKLKPRGQDYPFVIVNDTGLDLTVWTDGSKEETAKEIKYQENIPWTFEDWRKIRENLDADTASTLGISFADNKYEAVHAVSAARVGEELFVLQPPVNNGEVHNRLSVNITLRDDNVKVITLRSTMLVENDADIPILIENVGSKQTSLEIKSKESKAVPIDLVYDSKLRVRPQLHTSYNWSDETIYWKDIMKKNNGISLRCPSKSSEKRSIYYFQTEAVYQHEEPLARIYPHLKLVISAPLEIENLLPYDFKYRLYDKNSRREWTGSVKRGVKSYVHVVSLDNLILLSVEPENCGYGRSEFAIINGTKTSEFSRESTMSIRGKNTFKLHIHYPRKQADSTSLKVVVYSPYVILNRSNLNIVAFEKGNMFPSPGKTSQGADVRPTMFSFEKFEDRKNRAQIKAENTEWSPQISFDAIGQSNQVRLHILGQQKEINFGVSISEGEGKYNLTKTVTIAPRYVFMNRLKTSLNIMEEGSASQVTAHNDVLLPLYGLRCVEKKSIVIKSQQGTKWTQPFSIDDVGQIYVKVQDKNQIQLLVKVTMLLEDATMFIHVEDANNQWPCAIKNFTDEEFYIYQNDPNINANGEVVKKDVLYKPIYYRIPPKSAMPYAYDYPNAIVKELIVRARGRERAVNLSEIGNLRPFRIPPPADDNGDGGRAQQFIVDLNVCADGPTQTLVISDYDPSKSLYKISDGNESSHSSSLSRSQGFEATPVDENYTTKIVTKFDGFGISLINTNEKELSYITIKGLEFRYNESNIYQNFSVKLKWVQIDNQLYGGIFPIVLYPSVVPKTGKELNEHPAFSASVCRVKDESHGVLFIKYATVLFQELTFDIGEDFLYALLDFAKFPGASWNKEQVDRLCDDNLDIPEPLQLNDTSDIYFEALHLQPVQANISFVRTDSVDAEDKTVAQNALMFCFNVLTMAMGNISDAPIKLNALFIENVRVPTPLLVDSIQTHYKQAFFYQLHNIVGSADFLGNPVGLFNLLSSGVIDIFYEPYQGFVLNDRPQELGIGLAKGGLSFMKKSVFGFSDSFSKITGSLAKGLSVATMDPRFQERRRLQMKRNKANHFAGGANSFFESITSGIGGIAVDPIEGASTGGAAGFLKGLGRGMIGLPSKTAIGVLDFASNISEGIRNTTTVFDGDGLERTRLPRYINPDGVIKPYSPVEAQGQYWLYTVDGGEYYDETYLAHMLLPGDEMAVLVTYRKIILFDTKSLVSKWVIKFDQVKSISVEATGLTVELKNRKGPFIPIPDRNNRTFLYQKIGIAVKEYNKHCRVAL